MIIGKGLNTARVGVINRYVPVNLGDLVRFKSNWNQRRLNVFTTSAMFLWTSSTESIEKDLKMNVEIWGLEN